MCKNSAKAASVMQVAGLWRGEGLSGSRRQVAKADAVAAS